MKACLLFTALLSAVACGIPIDVGAPSDPFPESGFLDVWKRDGKIEVFEGANLYGHINGGAEVFFELGFDRLDVLRFVHDDDEIDVELYWMAEPASALGIYLMSCGVEQKNHTLEARHTAGRYQIQLLKGRAYLKVNNLSVTPEAAQALVHFAQYVEQRIPEEEPSDLLDLLPEEGRIENTERILRGPYTLEQVCDIGPGDLLQLDGRFFAVTADYEGAGEEPFQWIQAVYPDEATAKKAFLHVGSSLDPRIKVISKEDSRLVFKNGENGYGEILQKEKRLNVKTNLAEKP